MQVTSIPKFIDTKNLTITRQQSLDEDRLHTEIEAVDPQGDSIVVSRRQTPSGPACVMPEVRLTVKYQEANAEPQKRHYVGNDEAGDLYMTLNQAKKGENLDPMAGMWIMADLQQKGGIGGAC